jgi:hypothetical protein
MNRVQILYVTHQHHVLSTQSGLRCLKIAKKRVWGEQDKVMVLRELKLKTFRRGGWLLAPPGLFGCPAVAQSASQLPATASNHGCGPKHRCLHRWLPLDRCCNTMPFLYMGESYCCRAIADLLLSSYPNACLFDRRMTDFSLLS